MLSIQLHCNYSAINNDNNFVNIELIPIYFNIEYIEDNVQETLITPIA